MISINPSAAQGYCKVDKTLASKVSYAIVGGVLTITDNTTYVAPDVRKQVQISVFDEFGHKFETQIAAAAVANKIAITLANPAGDGTVPALNPAEGLHIIATVVSDLGKIKDGSVKYAYTSGDLSMEL